MTYISTKTFNHDIGLSCAFRQWRAESHCRFLHGYALAVRLEFESETLDARNWVVDFGGLKEFKEVLCDLFDHKLVVARDDPDLRTLDELGQKGLAKVVILDSVGCEAFAAHIFHLAKSWLYLSEYADRVRVRLVEVREHGANSAIYTE